MKCGSGNDKAQALMAAGGRVDRGPLAMAGVKRPGSSVTHLLTAKGQCPPKPRPLLLVLTPPNLLLERSPPRHMPFKASPSYSPSIQSVAVSFCPTGPMSLCTPVNLPLLSVSGLPPPAPPPSSWLSLDPVSGPSEFANHLSPLIALKHKYSQGTAQPKPPLGGV